MRWLRLSTFCLAAFLLATSAVANAIWPALFVASRLVTWYVILASLAIEAGILLYLLRRSVPTIIAMTLAMNLASVVLGGAALLAAGVATHIVPQLVLPRQFQPELFGAFGWTATLLFSVVINTAVEGAVLALGFGVKLSARVVCWLALANGLSVSLALLSLSLSPPHVF
jgi:hypothetical protein